MVFYVLIVNDYYFPLSGVGDWEGSWQAWDEAERAYNKRKLEPSERKFLVKIDKSGYKIEKSSI